MSQQRYTPRAKSAGVYTDWSKLQTSGFNFGFLVSAGGGVRWNCEVEVQGGIQKCTATVSRVVQGSSGG